MKFKIFIFIVLALFVLINISNSTPVTQEQRCDENTGQWIFAYGTGSTLPDAIVNACNNATSQCTAFGGHVSPICSTTSTGGSFPNFWANVKICCQYE